MQWQKGIFTLLDLKRIYKNFEWNAFILFS